MIITFNTLGVAAAAPLVMFGAHPRKRSRYSNKAVGYSNEVHKVVKEAVYGSK